MSKLEGYVQLMRPVNCLMMGFAVVVGAAIASPQNLLGSTLKIAFGFTTGFTLTAASMAVNDYYDREIDAVNEPNRPIPSGLIEAKEGLIFAFVLTVVGLLTALITNILCLATSIIAWIFLLTYNTLGKSSGLPGNFLVSTCVSIPFIYGSLAIVEGIETNVLIFAIMAFLSNTGREITKGIVDVEGDRMEDINTIAVQYGERKAAITAAIFYISSVLLSPIPWILGLVSFWFVPLVAVTDFGLITSSFTIIEDYSRENARRVKNAVLWWFLIGLLAFIAGSI